MAMAENKQSVSPMDEFAMEESSFGSSLVTYARRNPFLTVGVLGFLTTVGIGAYRFKNRKGGYPMSLFLIQLRVTAQSAVVGTLVVGMVYNMASPYLNKKEDQSHK